MPLQHGPAESSRTIAAAEWPVTAWPEIEGFGKHYRRACVHRRRRPLIIEMASP